MLLLDEVENILLLSNGVMTWFEKRSGTLGDK